MEPPASMMGAPLQTYCHPHVQRGAMNHLHHHLPLQLGLFSFSKPRRTSRGRRDWEWIPWAKSCME
jgi:hypothetical protein